MFETAEECADSAAVLFAARRWTWFGVGIPDRTSILKTLWHLKSLSMPSEQVSSGRLCYCDGQFGHEAS